jgi:hypothetical protein
MDTYTLPDGTEWKQHFLFCSCEGQCAPHTSRPLICRIYPYFPTVDVDGNVTGFEFSALMDLCYEDPAKDHPCTLVRERDEDVRQALAKAMTFLKQRPDLIFAFMVLRRLADTFRDAMGMTLDTAGDSGQFFKKFEWLVFSRKAWRKKEFIEGVMQDLQRVRDKYGRFDLD